MTPLVWCCAVLSTGILKFSEWIPSITKLLPVVFLILASTLLVVKPVFADSADLPMLHWNIVDVSNPSTVYADPASIDINAGTARLLMAEFDPSSIGGWSTVTHTDFHIGSGDSAQIRPCKTTYNFSYTWANWSTGCPPGNANGYSPISMFDNPAIYGYPDGYTDMMNNNVWHISSTGTYDPATFFLRVTYTAPTATPTPTPTPTATPTPTPTPWPNYNGETASNSAQYMTGADYSPYYSAYHYNEDSTHLIPCGSYADCWNHVSISVNNSSDVWEVLGFKAGLDGTYGDYVPFTNPITPGRFILNFPTDILQYTTIRTIPDPDYFLNHHFNPPVLFTMRNIDTNLLSTVSGVIRSVATTSAVPGSFTNNLRPAIPITCGSIDLGIVKIPDFFCEFKQWFYALVISLFVPNQAALQQSITTATDYANSRMPIGYIQVFKDLDFGAVMESSPSSIPDFAMHIPLINVAGQENPMHSIDVVASGSAMMSVFPTIVKIRHAFSMVVWAVLVFRLMRIIGNIVGAGAVGDV
jgi:hypothetical protein